MSWEEIVLSSFSFLGRYSLIPFLFILGLINLTPKIFDLYASFNLTKCSPKRKIAIRKINILFPIVDYLESPKAYIDKGLNVIAEINKSISKDKMVLSTNILKSFKTLKNSLYSNSSHTRSTLFLDFYSYCKDELEEAKKTAGYPYDFSNTFHNINRSERYLSLFFIVYYIFGFIDLLIRSTYVVNLTLADTLIFLVLFVILTFLFLIVPFKAMKHIFDKKKMRKKENQKKFLDEQIFSVVN